MGDATSDQCRTRATALPEPVALAHLTINLCAKTVNHVCTQTLLIYMYDDHELHVELVEQKWKTPDGVQDDGDLTG